MNENIVDDRGTTQEQAVEILENMLTNGFDDDVDQLAVVLGRTTEEITAMLDGSENIDDDLVMKMRGIAENRNITIE